MAIYHVSAQIIGRSAGRSSVAAAAYRSAERIRDERTGQIHDYTKRHGIESEIHTPGSAPEWMRDRSRLWNAAEEAETRKDAQLAREMNIALPRELSADEQKELVRSFVREEFVNRGMVADVAYHHNDPENPHAHVMLTLRDVTPEGFGSKNRDWNHRDLLEAWREKWEEHANQALERAGRNERIDHRTLEAQGINREPTRHLGPAAAAMERKHIPTERMAEAGMVREYNDNLLRFREEKARLETLRRERREHARLVQAARRQNWEMRSPRPPGEIKHERREGEQLTTTRRRSQLAEQERFWSGRHAHAIKSLESAKGWRDSPAGLKANWDYWKNRVAEGSRHPIGLMFSQKDRNMLRYAKRREFDAMLSYRTRQALEAVRDFAGRTIERVQNEVKHFREMPSPLRVDELRKSRYLDRAGAEAIARLEKAQRQPVVWSNLQQDRRKSEAELKPLILERGRLSKVANQQASAYNRLHHLAGEWERANARVEQKDRAGDGLKRLVSRTAADDYAARVAQRDAAAARYWEHVRASGYSDPHELLKQAAAGHQEAAAAHKAIEERIRPIQERLALYKDASAALEAQARVRIEKDPNLKRRHEERLKSGLWDPSLARAVRDLEALNGQDLSRGDLEALARGRSFNDREAQALVGQRRADELRSYQEQARTHPETRHLETDREIRANRRAGLRELNPRAAARSLTQERETMKVRQRTWRQRPDRDL